MICLILRSIQYTASKNTTNPYLDMSHVCGDHSCVTTSLSSFLHMRRGVETPSNKLEGSCVRMCIILEKISKYTERNYGGTIEG